MAAGASGALPDRQRIVARLLAARARVADIQDHLPEAIELWGRACAIAEANSLSDLLPVILQARGSRYGRVGDFEKGEADLRKAIALAEQNHDRYVLASALANMGYYLAAPVSLRRRRCNGPSRRSRSRSTTALKR